MPTICAPCPANNNAVLLIPKILTTKPPSHEAEIFELQPNRRSGFRQKAGQKMFENAAVCRHAATSGGNFSLCLGVLMVQLLHVFTRCHFLDGSGATERGG